MSKSYWVLYNTRNSTRTKSMPLSKAIDEVNASAAPSDWLVWCEEWDHWKPVVEAFEFSGNLKNPEGVTALPNKSSKSHPVALQVRVECGGELFKTTVTDLNPQSLDVHQEAPRKFMQEYCHVQLQYALGPETRKIKYKAKLRAHEGQQKKWSLENVPAHIKDFLSNYESSVEYSAPQTHKKAA